jgi:hypothetical protein
MKEHHDQKQAKLIEITKREQAPNHIHSDVEIIDTSGSTTDISTLNLNRISPTSIIHVHSQHQSRGLWKRKQLSATSTSTKNK